MRVCARMRLRSGAVHVCEGQLYAGALVGQLCACAVRPAAGVA
jgi:hypothetical protein